jgi:formamidopyrimidine-DNA glycosylase
MPELPEVETAAHNLRMWARGKKIVKVVPAKAGLAGARVDAVRRRGKWILCEVDGGGLGLHLGMTGKLAHVRTAGAAWPRFTRVRFELGDGWTVCFVDMRKFGRVVVARRYEELLKKKEIAQVGPDALEIDAGALGSILGKSSRAVKDVIMDQTRIAGVGNLYATEALWRAKIHPARPARMLGDAEVRALRKGIRDALAQGLRQYHGVELPEYIEEGGDNPFACYDRKGERCRRCKRGVIEAVTIGGRTSAYCPVCQPTWQPKPARTTSRPRASRPSR